MILNRPNILLKRLIMENQGRPLFLDERERAIYEEMDNGVKDPGKHRKRS